MTMIPDFNDTELWTIQTALKERFGEEQEIQLAETEIRLNKHTTQLTLCPAAYWEHDKCHFVVCKTAAERYRCMFFYRVHQMYGTGIEEFDNLTECVVTLLQVQADHAAKERAEQEKHTG
jgi:hypothetical protein